MKPRLKCSFARFTIAAATLIALLHFSYYFNAPAITRRGPRAPNAPVPRVGAARNATSETLILYWHRPWRRNDSWPWEGWKFGNCTVTYDRARIRDAAALMFHYTSIAPSDLPWSHYRRSDQLYIWWSAENPVSVRNELQIAYDQFHAFDGFFNWTMTYMPDADIFGGYGTRGELLTSLPRGADVVDAIVRKKDKLAILVVSNCGTTRGARARMRFVQQLRAAGLPISLHGACFRAPNAPDQVTGVEVARHKFYLAFENAARCRYYVTEKFWDNALRRDAVPVVWGAPKGDVTAVAPIDSFVHADDFASPTALVEYLLELDSDDAAYRKYFRWRENARATDEDMLAAIGRESPGVAPQAAPASICERVVGGAREGGAGISIADKFVSVNPRECLDS